MALPQIVTPEYSIQLKSLPKPIRYRPYLVKEEKILLMAKQSDDPTDIQRAVVQILKNCTFDEVNIDALPAFDLEYLFLQIRAKSVNNVVTINYECRNIVRQEPETDLDDRRCHTTVPFAVDLNTIQIETPDGHSTIMTLENGIRISLRYPSIAELQAFANQGANTSSVQLLAACLDTIVDAAGETYEARDYTMQERVEFVESIGVRDLEQFGRFFETMPSIRTQLDFTCPTCQYQETIELRGLEAFFI